MKKWQKVIISVTFISILILALGGLLINVTNDETGSRINILLLGRDAQNSIYSGNTDSITILSIDKNTRKVSLLSIPRDSKINIQGHGMDKINAAYGLGGINLTVQTVENFLNVSIDYYVVVNFDEFKSIVDTLGGVYIDVEPHVAAARPELNGKAGYNKLNGEQTLLYARFRQDGAGDIGRVERHQKILAAIYKEALKPGNIVKLPSVMNQLRENTHTSIPPYEFAIIEQVLTGFDLDNAQTALVTGKGQRINGIYYLIPDKNKTEQMVIELGLRN
jgi:LCP family protein required for cell wall assembly